MKVFLAGETLFGHVTGDGPGTDGWQLGALTELVRRRLYSFYYHPTIDREVSIAIDSGMELFLDSGAFSAHTQGKAIKLDEYARFIDAHGKHFAYRANLDDIGDTGPKSWENMIELNAQGCNVFPVFHHQDDPIYLKRVLDGEGAPGSNGYDFMALGGLVGASRNVLREWLDKIWTEYLVNNDGTPKLKVHGFGLTDTELMLRYPWYSVDSSSWIMTGVFGGCILRENDRFIKITFSDDSPDRFNKDSWHYSTLPDAQRAQVDRWLARHRVTARQLAEHYTYRNLVNARTFVEIEQMATPPRWAVQQKTLFDV